MPTTPTTGEAPATPEPQADFDDLETRYTAWKADPDANDPLTREEAQRRSGYHRQI